MEKGICVFFTVQQTHLIVTETCAVTEEKQWLALIKGTCEILHMNDSYYLQRDSKND